MSALLCAAPAWDDDPDDFRIGDRVQVLSEYGTRRTPGEVRLVAHDGMVYIELGRAGFYECRWYPPARLEPVVTDHTNPNDDEPY
jgi:hypothetical protein